MKDIKIYFLGRTQGYSIHKYFPSKIENRRRYEKDGFYSVDGIKRTLFKSKADILFFRNKPEKTTDKIIYSLSNEINNINKQLIINDIRSFNNYDSKDRSFNIWKKNKLQCPEYIAFDYESIIKNKVFVINRIKSFISKHNKIILRTNNETGSQGLYVIDNLLDIESILNKLLIRLDILYKIKKDSKIMCVEFIDATDNIGYQDLYRAHVLFDQIICYYVSTSKRNILYNSIMEENDINRFLTINENFKNILPMIKGDIIKAVSSLGNNIGAIEFLLINNKPCFIELNPMWGGHASRSGFGNEKMMKHLIINKKILQNKVNNIYQWLDYKNFYSNLYSLIKKHYINNY